MIPPTQMNPPAIQSNLSDALGAEMKRKQKMDEIKKKYGMQPSATKQAPVKMQWEGDNQS